MLKEFPIDSFVYVKADSGEARPTSRQGYLIDKDDYGITVESEEYDDKAGKFKPYISFFPYEKLISLKKYVQKDDAS